MSERHVIENSDNSPVTVASLVDDLGRLGVKPGMTLLVHSSLSSMGWVCGGSVAVVQALESVLGPAGTLVMPTHSGELSDPQQWSNPPVPASWWQAIRDTMPAYDPQLTPTRGMGKIPETFRCQAGVVRSNHPQASFAAMGPYVSQITDDHQLEFGLGENSPLARIYDLAGWILLLGVDHGSNTSLHLAELRAENPTKQFTKTGAPLLVNGKRTWCEFEELDYDASDFSRLGEAYTQESQQVRQGRVGQATAQLMPQRELVDFAVRWLEANR